MSAQEDFELIEAVTEHDHTRLHRILASKNDQHVRNTKQGDSNLLHLAVGSAKCVRMLLDRGVSVTDTDKNGFNPFHLAARGDYSESLLQLYLHGSDLNMRTTQPEATNGEGKTALEIAIDSGSTDCMNVLLFCGAEQTNKLDDKQRECQARIRHGYKENKIRCGGMTAKADTWIELTVAQEGEKHVGIAVKSNSEDFEFVCRRIQHDFQSSSIHIKEVKYHDGAETLITDIYQYRVNKDVTCDIRLPLVLPEGKSPTKYQEYIVRQSYSRDEHTAVEVTIRTENNMVDVENLHLFAHGEHPMVGLGVFLKNKVQKIYLNPSLETTVTSPVDANFQITVPPGGMNSPTVNMEVLQTEKEIKPAGLNEACAHTDFCNVRASATVEGDDNKTGAGIHTDKEEHFSLRLPTPTLARSETPKIMSCNEGDSGLDPDSWKETTDVIIEPTKSSVGVTKGRRGSYIVIATTLKKVTFWLRDFISSKFRGATNHKVDCILFAAIKPASHYYLVHIVLTDKEHHQNKINKFNDCFIQPDMKVSISINKKVGYMLKLQCYKGTGKIVSEDSLPVRYQGSQEKTSTFCVKAGSGPCLGKVLVFKKSVPKRLDDYEHIAKSVMPIYYTPDGNPEIPEDQFPSDKFIFSLSQKLGVDWFEIGIRLGNTNEILHDMDHMEPTDRNSNILRQWRTEFFKKPHEALTKLFNALDKDKCGRTDLINACVEEISKRAPKDTKHSLQQWLDQNVEIKDHKGSRRVPILRLNSVPDSPIGDATEPFLFSTAKRLSPDFPLVFFEMGLKNEHVNLVKFEKRNDTNWQKFQLLLKTKRMQCRNCDIKFLKTLLKALRNVGERFTMDNIKEDVRTWLEVEGANINKQIRDSLESIIK